MSGDCPTIGDLMTGRALLPLVALLMGEGVLCEMELLKGLQIVVKMSFHEIACIQITDKLFEIVNFHEIEFCQKIGLRRRTRAEPVIELISKVVLLSLERQSKFHFPTFSRK